MTIQRLTAWEEMVRWVLGKLGCDTPIVVVRSTQRLLDEIDRFNEDWAAEVRRQKEDEDGPPV